MIETYNNRTAPFQMPLCKPAFMVERGHDDPVGTDEWVSFEYSAVRRFYDKMGIGDRTEIEIFSGPHTFRLVGTLAFLRRHLHWPE